MGLLGEDGGDAGADGEIEESSIVRAGVEPLPEKEAGGGTTPTGTQIPLGEKLHPCPITKMKRYKVYNEFYNVYFSTSTIVEWQPVFTSDVYFTIIIDSLKYCQSHKGLNLIAYVIMPEHIHLITSNLEEVSLSDIMRDFKRFTSKKISSQLKIDNKNSLLEIFERFASIGKGNTEYKVWQDDFHPEAVYSEKFLQQKADYIHFNPVKSGLVSRPEDWLYSSARNYMLNDETILTVDKFLDKVYG